MASLSFFIKTFWYRSIPSTISGYIRGVSKEFFERSYFYYLYSADFVMSYIDYYLIII